MAAVVLPEQVEDAGTDLRQYNERHHRWFFDFFLATLVISVAKDVVLTGRLPTSTNLAFHALMATGCAVGLVLRRRRFHEVIGVTFAAAIVAYIGTLFTHLS